MSAVEESRIRPAPVRRSVVVAAPPERAFAVFVERFDAWWPASHSIGRAPIARAVLEPFAGGRWYEVGTDGAECPWGDVVVYEPPARLVLAWRIGADWTFHADLLTEVEVRFEAVDGGTRVDLEHRGLERMGDAAAAARAALDSPQGWAGILDLYAQVAGEAAGSAA